ncbi:MAG: adenylyltransferase/cytidyltransferase family protein [Alphaproteobacteria bacterium]|nr:adenylyltransferase/cytidyltransferase family protein [Alphaproteobacteria bacterium]
MTRVLTYGTFDTFHWAHMLLLQRARAMGDWLGVGLSTDEFNAIKGKTSVFNYAERENILRGIKYVDLIFPERTWEQKREDIVKYGADIFVIGDDWRGKFDDLSDLCRVVYLPRSPNISSTLIKQFIKTK